MRIVLKEGKQREFLDEEKRVRNLNLKELAEKIGIRYERLKAHYYQGTLLPEDIFKKCITHEKYLKHIEERREETWGKEKGGTNSSGNKKSINKPLESRELAEFYGIMLGDGNLTIKKGYKIGTYQIRITGDSRHDKKYFIEHVKPMIESLFNIKVKLTKEKNKNAINLVATGKELAEFLESKGFKAGDKIENKLRIPSWIKERKERLRRCLRGLYDTDGSVYKLTNQNSHQICFTNYNQGLLQEVREALISLGIAPSKITKGRDIVITKKEELRKFLNEVGFANERHLAKVHAWNHSPIV